jgi:hypothetical protein
MFDLGKREQGKHKKKWKIARAIHLLIAGKSYEIKKKRISPNLIINDDNDADDY